MTSSVSPAHAPSVTIFSFYLLNFVSTHMFQIHTRAILWRVGTPCICRRPQSGAPKLPQAGLCPTDLMQSSINNCHVVVQDDDGRERWFWQISGLAMGRRYFLLVADSYMEIRLLKSAWKEGSEQLAKTCGWKVITFCSWRRWWRMQCLSWNTKQRKNIIINFKLYKDENLAFFWHWYKKATIIDQNISQSVCH